jgi:hypothetical protein
MREMLHGKGSWAKLIQSQTGTQKFTAPVPTDDQVDAESEMRHLPGDNEAAAGRKKVGQCLGTEHQSLLPQ